MKETLRKNLDKVIWNIEQARITISVHHNNEQLKSDPIHEKILKMKILIRL